MGWELNRTLLPLGDVQAVDYPEINLAEADHLRAFVRAAAPDVIVNAAAYTAVDRAESDHDLAFAVNAMGPGILAEEAKKLGATLIHYSTDYVFDGEVGLPYVEDDPTNPLGVYGLSKLKGEQAVQAVNGNFLIFRTSWVYSFRQQRGFANQVLKWAHQQETLRIVDDQIGNPTWARMLAEVTFQVLMRGSDYVRERKGLYHLAGGGYASRLEWAREIIAQDPAKGGQKVKRIEPAKTSEFPTLAKRPLFSALDCSKFSITFGLRPPVWRKSLETAFCFYGTQIHGL